jgi:hypothetical protein
LTVPVYTASTLTAHPKILPRLETAMGHEKFVSVMMCLLLRMMAVLNTRYRKE